MPGATKVQEKKGFSTPVRYLKGVGPQRALALERLEVRTMGDLLYQFPRDWQDRRETQDFTLPTATGLVALRGAVTRAAFMPAGPTLGLFKATINTGHGAVEAVWFKHRTRRFDVFSSLKRDLVPGTNVWVIGRSEPGLLGIEEIQADEYYLLEDERWRLHAGRLTPVYPLTEGISQRFMRELVHAGLTEAADAAPELLPPQLLSKRSLLAAAQSLRGIHFPGSSTELAAARSRLAYEELLLLELAWILKRRQTRGLKKSVAYEIKRSLLTPFREKLGFELTGAQKRVINEIFTDLREPWPMTRLLQGDVGSGKTVVAIAALLLAVENGRQGALMAPTEILAEQHKATLDRLLAGMPVRVGILTSRVPAKKRVELLAAVRRGEVDILVGTHALLEGEVHFPRLSLAVIDEQHRFGVRQRTTLRQKGSLLDLLVMTATPIPRTLALALYGDLDVSTLDELPPGKAGAATLHAPEGEALNHLKAELAAGRQAFIVYPIIEESSRVDLQSAKAEFERLKAGPLAGLKVALIHGGMPGPQKSRVMAEFAAGAWQVLVATPVIEVGIDVPNATVMIIQNADRFGLASLHQLRGRIGRGTAPSRCFLVAEPRTPEAKRRIDTLVATQDGFRIGEEDLRLRGPGELLGMAQHGELSLKVADILKDAGLLAFAREDAEALLAADPKLAARGHALMRERLLALYQRQWNWIDLS